MLVNHDQFSPRLRNRLKTTGMGLGLVRLLLNAGRADEARTALSSLQSGFRVPEVSIKVRATDRVEEFAVQAHSGRYGTIPVASPTIRLPMQPARPTCR